jgi:hypothetical protein
LIVVHHDALTNAGQRRGNQRADLTNNALRLVPRNGQAANE